jgi:CheY-like chemotaxis protein
VLLVEDQDAVAAVARATLHLYGYQVLEARQGREALAICERHEGTIHLVVTDVVMPVMGGPELADRLWEILPQTRVLFMSGYTERAFSSHADLDPRSAFLQKPFMPEKLARSVREILDKKGVVVP